MKGTPNVLIRFDAVSKTTPNRPGLLGSKPSARLSDLPAI